MSFSTAQSQVATALKELSDCPENVKQMFLTSLPNVFGPDLHQYQKDVASMMRSSLEAARTSAAHAQDATVEKVEEARTSLEVLQANLESTQGSEDAARSLLDEKTAALDAAKAQVTSEKIQYELAKASKDSVADEREKLEASKAEVDSVMNGSFQMLLNGGWEDDDIRDVCIAAVCDYLTEEDGDVVLLAALPKALLFPPAKRGVFDTIAIDEAFRTITEKVSAIDVQLAAGEEKFEDATAESLGAWAIWDVARDREKTACEMRDKVDYERQAATVDKKLALSNVHDQDATLANVLSQATLLESKVQQLDLALAALTQLETGELLEKENAKEEDAMVVDKENVSVADKGNMENAMMVDKDTKATQGENAMEVDEVTNENVLSIERLPLAVAA